MKHVRDTGSQLSSSELHLALQTFSAEAAPLARRGRWLVREADLLLGHIGRRRAELRRRASQLYKEADGLEAAAQEQERRTRPLPPPQR